MRLILTRHGETIQNKENIVQGHGTGVLSVEGVEQAKKLGIRLMGEKNHYSKDVLSHRYRSEIFGRGKGQTSEMGMVVVSGR